VTLPGGGTWTYAQGTDYIHEQISSDDPNQLSQRLVPITDDVGRRVEPKPGCSASAAATSCGGTTGSFTYKADGLRWQFRLNQHVHWQDGVPLTAADVVFTARLMNSPAFSTTVTPGLTHIVAITATTPTRSRRTR